jgi:hypothetical protein
MLLLDQILDKITFIQFIMLAQGISGLQEICLMLLEG